METDTVFEAVHAQCSAMLHQTKLADERGYVVLVHGLNQNGTHNQYLHPYLTGGFRAFLEDWSRANGRRILVVNVFLCKSEIEMVHRTGRPFDSKFLFRMRVPKLVRFKPVCAAIELMAAKLNKDLTRRGSGPFLWKEMSETNEYTGEGRTALETLIRILDIHREILVQA